MSNEARERLDCSWRNDHLVDDPHQFINQAYEGPILEQSALELSSPVLRARMRFVYFSVLFATAYWFLVSLIRLIIAKRNVNIIVQTPERSANVNALERAWSAEEITLDEEIDQ